MKTRERGPLSVLRPLTLLFLLAVAVVGCSKPARYGESPNNLKPPPKPTIDPYVKNCQVHLEFSIEAPSSLTLHSAERLQDSEEKPRVVIDHDIVDQDGTTSRSRFECHYLPWDEVKMANLDPRAHYLEVQGISRDGIELDQEGVVNIRVKAHRALIDEARQAESIR